MATYVHKKSQAFRKFEDVQPPVSKRSECRLKRYTSVTDARAWANSTLENKAYICDFMSQETPMRRKKVIGQIIPIETVWKILLTNKNNYIYDLEHKIKSFVDLIRKINLSNSQIDQIREMCATTFRSINDYLMKYEITITSTNVEIIEKSIQAIPRTFNSITETGITTFSTAMRTVPIEVSHKFTNTRSKILSDKTNEPMPRSVCDVCLQVRLAPLPTADKCVSVKVRPSSEPVIKKPTMKNRGTKTSTEICTPPLPPVTSDKSMVTKAQSEVIHVSEAMSDKSVNVCLITEVEKRSTADIHTETSRDDVTFAEGSPSVRVVSKPVLTKSKSEVFQKKLEHLDPVLPGKPRKSCVTFVDKVTEKAFSSDDSIDPIEILNDIIRTSRSSELIEVVSHGDQVSQSEMEDKALVQLYRSTKTESIVSTYIVPSEHAFRMSEKSIAETEDTSVQTWMSNPINTKNADANTVKQCVDQSGNQTDEQSKYQTVDHSTDPVTNEISCAKRTQSQRSQKTSDKNDSDDDDDNDKFHDCVSSTSYAQKKNHQETQFITCLKKEMPKRDSVSRKSCKRSSTTVERKDLQPRKSCLKKGKIPDITKLARTAINQLNFIRQTLLDNNVKIHDINISKLVQILKSDNCSKELVFQSFLFDCGGFNYVEPHSIINEQLLFVAACCEVILASNPKASVVTTCVPTGTSAPKVSAKGTSSKSLGSHLKVENVESISIPSNELSKISIHQQIEYYKMKLIKMEQLNFERTKLQEKVFTLEREIKEYDKIKYELASDPKIVPLLGPDEILHDICEMKRKLVLSEHTKSELECQKSCVEQLTERISQMSVSRMSEFQMLRKKAQEAEILQLELDRLRIHFTDMKKLRVENVNLHNKCTELQKNMPIDTESDSKLAKEQADKVEKLQKEKEALLCTIVIKELEIVDQEDEISRLVGHVDRLTTVNEAQQEKSKLVLSQLRSDLTAKENYISKIDNNIGMVEEKLKVSITSVCKDSTQLQTKVCQLESECGHYKAKNDSMQDTINSLRKQLQMQEELNKTYSSELQKRSKPEHVDATNSERTLSQKMKSVNRMETILNKSHIAVRKVVEKLARDYRCNLSELQEIMPNIVNN